MRTTVSTALALGMLVTFTPLAHAQDPGYGNTGGSVGMGRGFPAPAPAPRSAATSTRRPCPAGRR